MRIITTQGNKGNLFILEATPFYTMLATSLATCSRRHQFIVKRYSTVEILMLNLNPGPPNLTPSEHGRTNHSTFLPIPFLSPSCSFPQTTTPPVL
jgi:hypothetical protein